MDYLTSHRFIDFINILLKHAEQTELYRAALDIEMEGSLLKRQSSNYQERWDKVEDSQGNVKWVLKKVDPRKSKRSTNTRIQYKVV